MTHAAQQHQSNAEEEKEEEEEKEKEKEKRGIGIAWALQASGACACTTYIHAHVYVGGGEWKMGVSGIWSYRAMSLPRHGKVSPAILSSTPGGRARSSSSSTRSCSCPPSICRRPLLTAPDADVPPVRWRRMGSERRQFSPASSARALAPSAAARQNFVSCRVGSDTQVRVWQINRRLAGAGEGSTEHEQEYVLGVGVSVGATEAWQHKRRQAGLRRLCNA